MSTKETFAVLNQMVADGVIENYAVGGRHHPAPPVRKVVRLQKEFLEMSKEHDVAELYREMEERRKLRAKRPISEKLAIAERLRDLQKVLAPVRAENKARATGDVEIRIKTR